MRITAALSRSPDSPFLPDVVATALSALEPRGIIVVVGLGARHANPSEVIPELLKPPAQGMVPMEAIKPVPVW